MLDPKILLVMDKTSHGGAEISTLRFLSQLHTRFSFSVAVLGDQGHISDEFRNLGIPVFELGGKHKGKWNPLPLWALIEIIRKWKIDLVHTGLLKSNILGSIEARLTGKKLLLQDRSRCLPTTLRRELAHQFPNNFVINAYSLVYRYCVRHADRVLVHTSQTRQDYIEAYDIVPDKIKVLPNGIDIEEVRNACEGLDSSALKKSLQIPLAAKIVTMVGRLSPPKDWFTFIRVAEQVPVMDTGMAQLYSVVDEVFVFVRGSASPKIIISRRCVLKSA